MDNHYDYDNTSNILAIQNQAPLPTRLNQLGGRVSQTFDYDEIYQLIGASGDYEAKNRKDRYMVNMQYDGIHNMSEDKRVCGAHSPEAQDGKLCLSKVKSKATKPPAKSSTTGVPLKEPPIVTNTAIVTNSPMPLAASQAITKQRSNTSMTPTDAIATPYVKANGAYKPQLANSIGMP